MIFKNIMKLQLKLLALLVGGLVFLSACSTNEVQVRTNYRDIAYDSLKTYRWHDKPTTASSKSSVNEIVYDYIKQTITNELNSKSYQQQETGKVDFLVNFSVTAKSQVDIRHHNVYSGVNQGFVWRRDGGFYSTMHTEQVTEYYRHREGTLIIDIVDPGTNKLIWRGVASKRLYKTLEKEQQENLIKEAVSAVLAKFPPEK